MDAKTLNTKFTAERQALKDELDAKIKALTEEFVSRDNAVWQKAGGDHTFARNYRQGKHAISKRETGSSFTLDFQASESRDHPFEYQVHLVNANGRVFPAVYDSSEKSSAKTRAFDPPLTHFTNNLAWWKDELYFVLIAVADRYCVDDYYNDVSFYGGIYFQQQIYHVDTRRLFTQTFSSLDEFLATATDITPAPSKHNSDERENRCL